MDAHLDSDEEDYIDMEVGFCHSRKTSPSHPSREFEFQMMFPTSSDKDNTTSPADELFYKGKLLPLHLPPRLQMVEKLLQSSNKMSSKSSDDHTCEEFFSTPLFTTTANTPMANTPFESCNVSPVESCQVSRELNPDEYLEEEASKSAVDDDQNSKKSWTRKLKLIKQSALGSKLKASRAYIKSFFNKSGCSVNKESAIAAMKTPFGQIQKRGHHNISSSVTESFKKKDTHTIDNEKGRHRRSFSGAIKRLSSSSSSSSKISSLESSSSGASSASSSNNSNGFQEMKFFKRSISSNLEVETPIQAAIAYCKKSQRQQQQLHHPRKTMSDLGNGICSLSASRIIHEDQETLAL